HRVPDTPGALIALVSWPEHSATYATCERLQTLVDSHPGSPFFVCQCRLRNSLVAAAGAGNTDTAKTLSFNLYSHEAAGMHIPSHGMQPTRTSSRSPRKHSTSRSRSSPTSSVPSNGSRPFVQRAYSLSLAMGLTVILTTISLIHRNAPSSRTLISKESRTSEDVRGHAADVWGSRGCRSR